MALTIAYPCAANLVPRRLRRKAIAWHATQLRQRLFGAVAKPLDVQALIGKTKRLIVNGQPMTLSWSLDGEIHDERGQTVLGVCEHDPDIPDTAIVSLNGPLLADQPEVLRSTAVHEFAHAIFDMPAALGSAARRTFRTSVAPAIAGPGAPVDWIEWRADEFMGAFLVPADRLGKAVARQAGVMQLPFGWRHDETGTPRAFIDADAHDPALGPMIDALAEEFGVTPSFISTRLHRGGFVRRRTQTQGDH